MVKTADCIYRDNIAIEAVSIGNVVVIGEYGEYYGMGGRFWAMYEDWEAMGDEEVVSVHSKGLIRW